MKSTTELMNPVTVCADLIESLRLAFSPSTELFEVLPNRQVYGFMGYGHICLPFASNGSIMEPCPAEGGQNPVTALGTRIDGNAKDIGAQVDRVMHRTRR